KFIGLIFCRNPPFAVRGSSAMTVVGAVPAAGSFDFVCEEVEATSCAGFMTGSGATLATATSEAGSGVTGALGVTAGLEILFGGFVAGGFAVLFNCTTVFDIGGG